MWALCGGGKIPFSVALTVRLAHHEHRPPCRSRPLNQPGPCVCSKAITGFRICLHTLLQGRSVVSQSGGIGPEHCCWLPMPPKARRVLHFVAPHITSNIITTQHRSASLGASAKGTPITPLSTNIASRPHNCLVSTISAPLSRLVTLLDRSRDPA
jgi:hypothetical protein